MSIHVCACTSQFGIDQDLAVRWDTTQQYARRTYIISQEEKGGKEGPSGRKMNEDHILVLLCLVYENQLLNSRETQ